MRQYFKAYNTLTRKTIEHKYSCNFTLYHALDCQMMAVEDIGAIIKEVAEAHFVDIDDIALVGDEGDILWSNSDESILSANSDESILCYRKGSEEIDSFSEVRRCVWG